MSALQNWFISSVISFENCRQGVPKRGSRFLKNVLEPFVAVLVWLITAMFYTEIGANGHVPHGIS